VSDHDIFEKLPDGAREVSPLVIIMFATAIPVALAAWAAIEDSTALLVVAVLAMVAVGTVTLTFMARITSDSDGEDQQDSDEPEQ
jgi:heme/copper-type cytochrome/quinol oxidase subunit 4